MSLLLITTTNQGKSREIKAFLQELPLKIFSLSEVGMSSIYAEEGKTFLENARGKSLFYSLNWDGLALGEDSGLEVFHLHGAPGIFSARFSGLQSTDEKNNRKVLSLLEGVPLEKRGARFVSALVLAQAAKVIKEVEEKVEGILLDEPRGRFGFGYDPIFFYPPLQKTFAELPPEEKNLVSHRGKALKKMKDFLQDFLAQSPARE